MRIIEIADEKLKAWERSLTKAYGGDISTPERRRAAQWHFNWVDHGALRTFWWNLHQIAPGVYRSNHPSIKRIGTYKKMGIKAILNLRGDPKGSPFLFESEGCATQGITLLNFALSARNPAPREAILNVIAAFRAIERPFLMHCKSGADRAGFASVLYLHIIEGVPLAEARKQLHWRYLHLKFSSTGVLDHILDMYEAHDAKDPVGLEQWFATEYDPDVVRASFAKLRQAKK